MGQAFDNRVDLPGTRVGYVYLVSNLANGKKYVGQTITSVAHRWSQHVSAAKKGSRYALHCAIRKYGAGTFQVSCLAVVEGTFEELLSAEVWQIAQNGSLYPNGYNLTPGGEGIDWTRPEVKGRHAAAVAESSKSPSWKAAQFEGASKRLADPEWRRKNEELLRQMHANPEWRAQHTQQLAALHSNPAWRGNLLKGIALRSEGPWKKKHAEAMATLHADPHYGETRDRNLQALNARRSEEAIQRDLLLPPEVAARRRRARELKNARSAERKTMKGKSP